MICMKAVVKGRVQGVWFRKSTAEKAQQLGLKGWVKNLATGDVELVAYGEEKAVRQLETWLAIGPELASVVDVDIQEITLAAADIDRETYEIR